MHISMEKIILIYITALSIFLLVDFIWLGVIAKNLYAQNIGHLMASKVNFVAAFVFYFIFIAGLLVFSVFPALYAGSLQKAIFMGAFFGFVTYATYDLTNLATLKDWPLSVTIIDLIWGSFIASLVSTLTFLIFNQKI